MRVSSTPSTVSNRTSLIGNNIHYHSYQWGPYLLDNIDLDWVSRYLQSRYMSWKLYLQVHIIDLLSVGDYHNFLALLFLPLLRALYDSIFWIDWFWLWYCRLVSYDLLVLFNFNIGFEPLQSNKFKVRELLKEVPLSHQTIIDVDGQSET